MDANKPVSPRDVHVESTTGPVHNSATTTASDGQHATAPRVYAGSDALPRFMTGPAPVAHTGIRASAPRWEEHGASDISLQKGSSTARSSSSLNQPTASVAHAPQDSHAKQLSFLQGHREKVIAAYSLTAEKVSAYDNLAASIKAGDRRRVIQGFNTLDSRKTLPRLLHFTNSSVMADAIRTGDMKLLEFLFDEAKDANFQDSHYDRMLNGYANAGGDPLLDIAASRKDLEIGLMLAENDAKPGPNCPRQFLDQLLEKAIEFRSEYAVRNLLVHGADWNLFFSSAGRDRFLHGLVMGISTFFHPLYQLHEKAENKQAALEVTRLWAGSDMRSNEKFDEEIKRYASDKNSIRVKKLLEMRPGVIEADQAKPTAALMQAIQIAVSAGTAATLKILLDHYMSVRTERSDAGRRSMAPARMADNISLSNQLLDLKDDTGRTLLHLAAQSGHAGKIALLLKRGASARELDGKKQLALEIAIKGKHIAAAVLLLRAALEATDNWPGKKATIRAAVSHADPEMKTALMNVYAEVQPGPPAKVASPRPYDPHEEF